MSETRTCAYCGRPRCRCKYKAGKAGVSFQTSYNVSAQTSLAELKRKIDEIVFAYVESPSLPTVWSFSFTRLDPQRVGKYKGELLPAPPEAKQ